ncbi:MAG: glycoside hydrolase family 3 protein [Alphaproteobacteria bacterium]|nr:glycoside hydrolase family 3 protein [Alphaproteobacteria bacterium]
MPLIKSLRKAPFNLSADDIAWVEKTLNSLSTEDKLRQLFVHLSIGDDPAAIAKLGHMKPGGLHRFMGPELQPAWRATRQFMEMAEVPPFITGDIEGGGHGSPAMLQFPNQLGLAAANDPALSRKVLAAVCEEARALGFNWSFTPVVDINAASESAIVGTRSYGSNQKRIAAQAKAHVEVLQAHGIAATAKHWPGEGFDARDQHLVTTVNPLSMAKWEETFGALYRGLIRQGVLTIMSAHIALPAYMRKKRVPEGLQRFRPASVNRHLNQSLLRGELGFNGLIVSDATPMAGLTSFAAREISTPEVIENGCDVFLFSPNPEQDYQFMLRGLREKRLSEQRLEEAVTRILALKAALGLHRKTIDERIAPLEQARAIIKSKAHLALADEAAVKSITKVKDLKRTLPLSLEKHRRIVLVGRGAPGMFPGSPRREMSAFTSELKSRGFDLRPYDPKAPPTRENADLLLYVFAVESSLGLSHIHVDWLAEQQGLDTGMARYWHDLPCLMVSFGHPYYLREAPRVPTYVNAYSTIEASQRAAARCLLGEAEFAGSSPVDVFAGAPDSRY